MFRLIALLDRFPWFKTAREVARFAYRRALEVRLQQVASSLTLTTVLSIVPLIAVALASLAAALLHWPVDTIASRFGSIPSNLPAFAWPEFSWDTAKFLLIPATTLALLGSIESLLCARIADQMMADGPYGDRHDANQELMAQGIANLVTPFFGGMPATGAIARTAVNVRSGARTRLAAIVPARCLPAEQCT
jgi:SulP family sulfate permease